MSTLTHHKRFPPNGNLSEWILNQFPEGYLGHAVDVGASDGVSINSTWALEKVHRWSIISVEANPDFTQRLKARRAFVSACACGKEPGDEIDFHVHLDCPEAFSALRKVHHPVVGPKKDARWETLKVPVRTVDQLLRKWDFPKLDALCVDTEGTENDVLEGANLEHWKPSIVVVESWDAGTSDEILLPLGYGRAGRNVHNDLYRLLT